MGVNVEVNHAAVRELDVEAAWEAAEMYRRENDALRKDMQLTRDDRDRYQLRSYGYSRIANIYKRIQMTAITQEHGWQLIAEALEDINKRLENQVSG